MPPKSGPMSSVKRSTVVAALLMCAAMLSFTVLDTIFSQDPEARVACESD